MQINEFLWGVFHQLHHNAERLDGIDAFYFSPLDMIGWALLGSLTTLLLVGVSPEVATLFLLVSFGMAVFQHLNIKTPRIVGYLIQRSESHSVHHERGLHKYNYADLSIFDILFGTFRNPKFFSKERGGYDGASSRVKEMLCCKDKLPILK